jgi:hypothetical protein
VFSVALASSCKPRQYNESQTESAAGDVKPDTSSNCKNLIETLKATQKTNLLEVKEVYECGPAFKHLDGESPTVVNGCLVYFEYQNSPYPSYTVAAFQDVTNNHLVDWIPHGDAGKKPSGKHLCADVYTYARVKKEGNTATVKIERETARDAMFCPFGKLFTAYSTTCRKVNKD